MLTRKQFNLTKSASNSIVKCSRNIRFLGEILFGGKLFQGLVFGLHDISRLGEALSILKISKKLNSFTANENPSSKSIGQSEVSELPRYHDRLRSWWPVAVCKSFHGIFYSSSEAFCILISETFDPLSRWHLFRVSKPIYTDAIDMHNAL